VATAVATHRRAGAADPNNHHGREREGGSVSERQERRAKEGSAMVGPPATATVTPGCGQATAGTLARSTRRSREREGPVEREKGGGS